MLDLGLVWLVGDGQEIEVWSEPWLFECVGPYVQTVRTMQPKGWKARDLMADDYGRWNEELVRATFSPFKVSKILITPLSSQRWDRLTWRHSKSGYYSV